MSEINELYQEIILDHNKHPRNWGKIATNALHSEGFNPLCGDRIDLYLQIEDGKVKDISFEANGCAISKASASIMTSLVKGKTIKEIDEISNQFHDVITKGCEHIDEIDEELEVFCGVKDFPSRVKCASLAWHTLNDVIKKENNE